METTASDILWHDRVLPFRLFPSNARGRITRLGPTLDDVLARHDYPGKVSAMVAEATLITALVGQTMRHRWKLSLQIRGDGPVRLIATDYVAPAAGGAPGRIRAYASFDRSRLAGAASGGIALLGRGFFALLVDQGTGAKPFQGITPLTGDSLAECAETYFDQSEQLATRFALALAPAGTDGTAGGWRGGGILLQRLPEGDPGTPDSRAEDGGTFDRAEEWNRLRILLETAQPAELTGPAASPEQVVRRLFPGEDPVFSPADPVLFGCSCGPEKVRQTMSIYSARDIRSMTDARGLVTADCQFCGARYEFEPETLGSEAKP